MTRPGRVEVYRTARHKSRWVKCTAATCDTTNVLGHTTGLHLEAYAAPGWSWRHFAANGREVSRCSEAHTRLRDVAQSLKLAFPGYRLLDQDRRLEGPEWFMWGMQFAYEDESSSEMMVLPEDLIIGVGMRGVRIPVAVPAGVSLGSRR